jgi:hypothetical protein
VKETEGSRQNWEAFSPQPLCLGASEEVMLGLVLDRLFEAIESDERRLTFLGPPPTWPSQLS